MRRCLTPVLASLLLASCGGAGAGDDGGTDVDSAAPAVDAATPAVDTGPPPDSAGAGLTPLFFSDWRTQSGGTEDAIQDGGKWEELTYARTVRSDECAEVIDAPADFPTARVLRVLFTNPESQAGIIPAVSTLGEIAVGQTRNYRWYYAMHEPDDLADPAQHPIQDGGAVSQQNWGFYTRSRADTGHLSNLTPGQWGMYWELSGAGGGRYYFGPSALTAVPLTKGVAYRFEVQLLRTDATHFRFHAWIHDAGGNLLGDDDDFHTVDGSSDLSASPTFTFNIVANTSIFVAGNNGIGNSPPFPVHHADEAAFAIVEGLPEGTAIGAYGNVIGEQP
jgi:hypothetical protein